jgi:hypothetical protein
MTMNLKKSEARAQGGRSVSEKEIVRKMSRRFGGTYTILLIGSIFFGLLFDPEDWSDRFL